MKFQFKLLIATLLLTLSGLATAGTHCPYKNKTRYMKAQDWQAMCRCADSKSSCIAGTRVIGWVSSIYGTAHVLRVKTESSGAQLSWKPRLYVPDERTPVSLKVDNLPTVMLMAGKGYTLDEGVVRLGNPALAANLLPSLKRGQRLKVGYTDQWGTRRQAVFSLAGMTRSMNFVEARMSKSKPGGATTQPRAAKPAAKAAPKPAAKPSNTATPKPAPTAKPAGKPKFE